eukprot:5625833-Amphidinium_carterae.1
MARRIVRARVERLRTHQVPRVVARAPDLRTECLLRWPLRLTAGCALILRVIQLILMVSVWGVLD